ncbi:3-phosphoshikimate 1-carboxyvinyltransferase [Methanobrevibacter sp. OttesenSCG-928-I08]|nr:3-phosphoshikimate 1-carboxyvinyltransferase [Methanobrevibacter sp. OttesenSCG-928-I08]
MKLKVKEVFDIGGVVKTPSSKSYSHRAIIIASLASSKSKIYDALLSEDTLASIEVCKSLGAKINFKNDHLEIIGTSKIHNSSNKPIYLANSGTTLRLITSIAGLSDNEVTLTGDESLKTRPMGPLIDALEPLGVKIKSSNEKAPLTVYPGYIGGETTISGGISSQFISSLLISAPLSKKGLDLFVLPEFISQPYVNMTIDIMNKFGVKVKNATFTKHDDCKKELKKCGIENFNVTPQSYKSIDYVVEGDYSSASYILAAVAILGGKVKLLNLFKDSKQGDKLILSILEQMGCKIIINDDNVIIESDGNLNGIDIDLSDAPDLLITVAILGAISKGKTKISGVKHGRFKETDRIATTCLELKKLNCDVEELEDGMIIGDGVSSGTVDSHKDHRLAMAFSLLGLKHDVTVLNGEVFNVSFPNYIEVMAKIGVNLELK